MKRALLRLACALRGHRWEFERVQAWDCDGSTSRRRWVDGGIAAAVYVRTFECATCGRVRDDSALQSARVDDSFKSAEFTRSLRSP